MNTKIIDTALQAASKLNQVNAAAKQAFVERDDFIDALTTAMASGEHFYVLGAPGTSKTAIGKFVAKSMEIKFFYKQGNPDLLRDDFEGPISTKALANDQWDRAWAGMAVADLAFVDEVGRASDQVQDLLLEMMEERSTSIANTIQPVPLHTAMSGSNSTIHHHRALWDRFTVRVMVDYIKSDQNFLGMLYTDLTPPSIPTNREELACLRCASSYIAQQRQAEVDQKILMIKHHLAAEFPYPVSDRRWRRCLKVAAGSALLRGSDQITVNDLYSSRWLLWNEPQHIPAIYAYIESQCNIEARQIREFTKLYQEQEDRLLNITAGSDTKLIAEISYKLGKIKRDIKGHAGKNWEELRTKIGNLEQKVYDLENGEI